MSGVEVAGLILGAFPIVLSALEQYRQGFLRLKSWWNFQRTFEELIDDVGMQNTMFESNLERLLSPFVHSDGHMGVLLCEPLGSAWQDAELEEKLRDRLRGSYIWYLSIVSRMHDALKELQRLLGIQDGQVSGSKFL
jgi:hypothetical protein